MPYRRYRAPTATLPHGRLLAGGALLAGSAGFVNAVLLSFFQVPVSHMSGAVSHLGVAIASRPISEALGALTIIAAFFLGSVVSGVLVGRDTPLPGRRYALVLLIQGLSLAAAGSCLYARVSAGVPLAAFACGVQNAMSSSYYGLAIRTTHVTGMVTDLGVIVGHWLRHRRFSRWKAIVLSTMTGAFLAGGILGAGSVAWLDFRVLYVPAVGTLAAAAAYYARAARPARTRQEMRIAS
ncbi:MAG: YoaK family protein [Gemmatimonadaceae bacterium]